MDQIITPAEMEALLGSHFRNLRLQKNWSQEETATRAGVSLTALKNLENGHNAGTKTMVSVLRALGRADWLNSLAPQVTINPLHMVREKSVRQRASRKAAHGQD